MHILEGSYLTLWKMDCPILEYADDTILFVDHDLEQAKNMKLLFCVIKQPLV